MRSGVGSTSNAKNISKKVTWLRVLVYAISGLAITFLMAVAALAYLIINPAHPILEKRITFSANIPKQEQNKLTEDFLADKEMKALLETSRRLEITLRYVENCEGLQSECWSLKGKLYHMSEDADPAYIHINKAAGGRYTFFNNGTMG